MSMAYLIILLFLFIFLGLPVSVSIGLPSFFYFVMNKALPNFAAIQRIVGGVNAYTLLAVPFFIFAGQLMNKCGVTERIFNACNVTVGRLKGGLAHVNILSSIIFAGMSGTAIADAGGLGAIEIKAMRSKNYDERMTIGITAVSAIIGPIIPPSLTMVIWGVVASVSVGRLFAAGIIPGFMMGLSLMVMVSILAGKMNCPPTRKYTFKEKWPFIKKAFLPFLAPVIILGGIFGGMFTPTEAASIASLYALILGIIYKKLNFKIFKETVLSTAVMSIQVLFIVAMGTLFAWILTREQVPQRLIQMIQELPFPPWVIILIINIFLLIVGLFMETVVSINILAPIILPILVNFGMEPVQIGIIMVLNLIIGTLTPPFGTVLFVLSGVAKVPVEKVAKSVLIFIGPIIFVLILINIIPGLTLWLPNLIYGD